MQCDYFEAGRCRSCTLMGVPYAAQLADKDAHVRAALAHAAPGARWLAPFAGPESGFRNKAKLVVGGAAGAVTLGILDRAGDGVDLQECGLYEPGLAAAFPALESFVNDLGVEPYDVPGRRGELKYLLVTHPPDGELMVRFVLRSTEVLQRIRTRLPRLLDALPHAVVVSANIHPEHKAVLEGDREVSLTGRTTLPFRVGSVGLHLPARAFFQTNTLVAGALYAQARTWVDAAGPASLWDLYCGVGGFALACTAPGREVLGVEVSEEAIDSATLSASATSGAAARASAGARFVAGDATAYALSSVTAPDLVVVNPPRRGIGPELAAWLERSDVQHVVYSSCNVESLARDLAAMPSLRAKEARLFDMFPQTAHHEVMVLLRRS